MREGHVKALVCFVVIFKQLVCASAYLKVRIISEYLIMGFCAKLFCALQGFFITWSERLQGGLVEVTDFSVQVCPLQSRSSSASVDCL